MCHLYLKITRLTHSDRSTPKKCFFFPPLPCQVDPRHLNLIADYMTFEGGYRPMNRMGIGGNASPLLRMSYETSMNFMTDACLHGETDDLSSPSAKIVMGQVVGGGTGSVQLLQPVPDTILQPHVSEKTDLFSPKAVSLS